MCQPITIPAPCFADVKCMSYRIHRPVATALPRHQRHLAPIQMQGPPQITPAWQGMQPMLFHGGIWIGLSIVRNGARSGEEAEDGPMLQIRTQSRNSSGVETESAACSPFDVRHAVSARWILVVMDMACQIGCVGGLRTS